MQITIIQNKKYSSSTNLKKKITCFIYLYAM